MKGTAPRGRNSREDARLKTWLAMDEKQRAENLMIVDLLRNDLGRIAKIGSVEVTDLFTVETYRTVHQMTSGITAELRGDIGPQGHAACAVPVRLGHRRAEGPRHGDHPRARGRAPRRLYRRHRPYRAERRCPVQRRHPHHRARRRGGEMGIGSGIVANSKVGAEFEECLLKAQFLTKRRRALPADRDHALGAGQRLLSARAPSRAAAILGRAFRLSLRPRRRACGARSRKPREPEGDVYHGAAAARRGRRAHRDLDRDRAPGQGHGVEIRRLRTSASTRRTRSFSTRRRGGSSTTASWNGKRRYTGCDEVIFLNKRGELTEGTRTTLFHRAGRTAVHAGARLRPAAGHLARGTDRSAARRRERGGADACRISHLPTASISAIRCGG